MKKKRDDTAGAWLPPDASQELEPPSELAALAALDRSHPEDVPTTPFLRGTPAEEPIPELDPLAAARGSAGAKPFSVSDLLPQSGMEPATQPIAASQIVEEAAREPSSSSLDVFQEFHQRANELTPSVEMAEPPEPVASPKNKPAFGQSAAVLPSPRGPVPQPSPRGPVPREPSAVPVSQEQPEPQESSSDLMSMLAGSSVERDESLGSIPVPSSEADVAPQPHQPSKGRSSKGRASKGPPIEDSGRATAEPDDLGGTSNDPSPPGGWDLLAGAGAGPSDDSFADFHAEADPDAHGMGGHTDDSIQAAFPTRQKKGGGRWIIVLLVLLLGGAGGGYGYYRYDLQQKVRADWLKVRHDLQRGSLAGAKDAAERLALIANRVSDPNDANAAQAFSDALLAFDLGEDRREAAQKNLDGLKAPSEWRTAAAALMGPSSAWEAAQASLKEALGRHPKSAIIPYVIGRLFQRQGRPAEAVKAYEQALTLASDYPAAQVARAGLIGGTPDGFVKATEALRSVLRRDPDHVGALVVWSRLRALHNQDLMGADADLKRIEGPLAQKASSGQRAWAQLAKAALARRRNLILLGPKGKKASKAVAESIKTMVAALGTAAKSKACCDGAFRYEVAGSLAAIFRFRAAKEQIELALVLDGENPDYRIRAARISLGLGDFAGARAHLAALSKARPESVLLGARVQLGARHPRRAEAALAGLVGDPRWGEQARTYLAVAVAQRGKLEQALAHFKGVLVANPRADYTARLMGETLLRARKLSQAERALKRAFRINSLDPRIASSLGQISVAKGDFARARRRFAYALSIQDDFTLARLHLAELTLSTGSAAMARALWVKIGGPQPPFAVYFMVDARIALAEGAAASGPVARAAVARAAQSIAKAKEAGLRGAPFARVQGQLLLAQRRAKKALPLLTSAQKAAPRDRALLLLLGQAQLAAGRSDDAYESFQDLLELDKRNPEALLELAKISIGDSQWPAAIKGLKETLSAARRRKRKPGFVAEARLLLGEAFLGTGDTGRALSNLQDAIELSPKNARAHYLMGGVYDRLDRPQRSVGYYKQAAALNPAWAEVLLALGAAQEKSGDRAAAVASYTRFLQLKPRHKKRRRLKRRIRRLKRAAR